MSSTTNVLDALAQVSGLTKADVQQAFEQVRLNRKKLRSCPKHQFEEGVRKLGARVRCKRCGGTMTLSEISNYIAGFRAAGGDPNEVWPGWGVLR